MLNFHCYTSICYRHKKTRKPRPSKKQLTAREKRNLGLYRLPKTGLQYASFTELADLWREYMRGLIGADALNKSAWKPEEGNLEDPKLHDLQMKICRADFHGGVLKVGFHL